MWTRTGAILRPRHEIRARLLEARGRMGRKAEGADAQRSSIKFIGIDWPRRAARIAEEDEMACRAPGVPGSGPESSGPPSSPENHVDRRLPANRRDPGSEGRPRRMGIPPISRIRSSFSAEDAVPKT